jgi:hypothetical protein
MYAYYTLSAIAIVYLIFAVLSLRYGKWYYLFIHPFAFICAEFILKYRYASEIPEMATYVDKVLAVGIILVSLAFGLGYCVLKSKYVERITLFLNGQLNIENGISKRKFWCWLGLIIVIILLYYVCQYVRFGKFEYLFFQMYYHWHELQEKLKESSFGMRATNWFIANTVMTIMFFVLVLLFEVLKKQKQICGIMPITSAFIISVLAMSVCFLTGSRLLVLQCVECIFVLMVISFFKPNNKLKKISILIIISLFFYCAIALIIIPQVRYYGISGIFEKKIEIFTFVKNKDIIQKYMNSCLAIQDNTEHLTHIQIDNNSNKEIDDNKKLEDQTVSDNHSINKIIETSAIPETSSLQSENTENKQNQDLEKQLAEELRIFKRLKGGHSMSRMVALVMLYYGRHEDYLGITYSFRSFINRLLPPPLGKDRNFHGIGAKLQKIAPRINACGPFGEGYASYGFTGGYLYWCGWAFICGLIAKIAMTNLESIHFHLEYSALSLFFIVWVPILLSEGFEQFYQPFSGFIIILATEFVFLRFIYFCNILCKKYHKSTSMK